MKIFYAAFMFGLLSRPFLLKGQDGGAQIENLEVADSLYMEQDFMADAVMKNSGSGNTVLIIVGVVIIIAAAAYFILKIRKR